MCRLKQHANGPRLGKTAPLLTAVLALAHPGQHPALAGPAFTVLHTFNTAADGVSPAKKANLLYASDGNLYGVTQSGGVNRYGTIYRLTPDGVLTTLHSFLDVGDGILPLGNLVEGSDGALYGVTASGGPITTDGTIYKINKDGSGYTTLHTFAGDANEGGHPQVGLLLAGDGNFYGVTSRGGANGFGAFFKMTPSGAVSVLTAVSTAGGTSIAATLTGSGSVLYGIANAGGNNGTGTIFRLGTDGTQYFDLHDFVAPGSGDVGGDQPQGILLSSDGFLYGTCAAGGSNSGGTMYKFSPSTDQINVIASFGSSMGDGLTPYGEIFQDSSGNLDCTMASGAANNTGAIEQVTASGSSYFHGWLESAPVGGAFTSGVTLAPGTTYYVADFGADTTSPDGAVYRLQQQASTPVLKLYDFAQGYHDAEAPYYGSLVADSTGKLYGTTQNSSYENVYEGDGALYSVGLDGTYTNLPHADGHIYGGLTLNGTKLWGTTFDGGDEREGSLFTLDTTQPGSLFFYGESANQTETPVFYPYSAPLIAANGTVYGTNSDDGQTNGSVWSYIPNGSENYDDFTGTPDGSVPHGALIQDASGLQYGTTTAGGPNNNGTVFKYDPVAESETVLMSLRAATTGSDPEAGLVLNPNDGYLYGVAKTGGANNVGTIFRVKPDGTAAGLVYTFGALANDTDGAEPTGVLTVGSDGKLYGTTQAGNLQTVNGQTQGAGTIFSYNLGTNKLTTIGTFPFSYSNGVYVEPSGVVPYAGVAEDIDGNLYGTTEFGGVAPTPGANVDGTVYRLAVQLPLVKSFTPSSAAPGASVTITGVNFTGATAVSFNGVAASSFTVNSATQIAAVVPSTASSGKIVVTTPNGAGTSATSLTVTAAASGPALSSVTLSPTSTQGGTTTTASRAYLSANATADTTVSIASSDTTVATLSTPTVTIKTGSSSHVFTIVTKAVTSTKTVTITATANGVSKSATLTVTPPPVALSSVSLSPTSVKGGTTTTASRAYLSGNATADTSVAITSSNPSVAKITTTPVTIKSGSSSHVFTIQTSAVTVSQTVTITASANGVSKTATLTVTP